MTAIAAAVPSLAVYAAWLYSQPLGLVDDAYIPMVYAKNILAGHGAVFYPGGGPVEGFTSPLWLMALTLAGSVGIPLPIAAEGLGIACGAAALVLTAALYRALFADRPGLSFGGLLYPALAALLVSLDASFPAWSAAGLETQGYALLALALALSIHAAKTPASPAFILLLAMLIRPEGVLLFPAAVWLLARKHGSWTKPLPALFLFAALPFAMFLAFRLAYFGYPLPNTFYAKHGFGGWVLIERGVHYVVTFFQPRALLALAVLAPLIEPAGSRNRLLPIGAVTAILIAGVILGGGDHFALHRFMVPALPFLSILTVRAIDSVIHGHLFKRPARKPLLCETAAAMVALAVFAGHASQLYEYKANGRFDFSRGARWHLSEVSWAENWADMGRWLGEKYPPGTQIAVMTAGAIPYYSGLPAIDLLGLNDIRIARAPLRDHGRKHTGHERSDPEYVLNQDPKMIQLFPMLFFSSKPTSGDELEEMLTYPAQFDLWNHPEFRERYAYKTEHTPYGHIGYFERTG